MSLKDDLKRERDERIVKEVGFQQEISALKEKDESRLKELQDWESNLTRLNEEVREANQNYHRELANHADARKSLSEAETQLKLLSDENRANAEQSSKLKSDLLNLKNEWKKEVKSLKESEEKADTRLKEAQSQNTLLHLHLKVCLFSYRVPLHFFNSE